LLRFLRRRLLAVIPILVMGTFFSFMLIELTPGDPAQAVLGEFATPEQVEAKRIELGLDRPFLDRYVDYMDNLMQLKFGESVAVVPEESVGKLISQAVPATLSLGSLVVILAVVVGVPLGAIAAVKRDSWLDRGVTTFMSWALAIPTFVLGPVLLAVFAINKGWFPVIGFVPIEEDPVEWLRHLALPAVALAAHPTAEIARQVRGSMVSELEESYVRTALAKGLGQSRVVGKHALKNAAMPVVTVLGLQVGRILGGSVIVESIFAIPGLGQLTYNAIQRSDFPVIQAMVVLTILLVVGVNLLVDLSYTYFDPKLRK
jgi:peptide/nickel transport system permease protein